VSDTAGTLVARWQGGDQQAATELFRRYVNRLTALARSRLSAELASHVDPEDVVQSVYRCFFANAREGRYEFERGGDLWQLLVAITLHKLQEQVRRNRRQKRSVQRQQNFGSEESLMGLQPGALAHEPSPVEAVALTEQLDQLMRTLEPLHRRILELRLQGRDVEEIAVATERTQRTVRRVLERIKQQLERCRADQG
jgi:RNA polymerase sigma factor (sigma-70 family)